MEESLALKCRFCTHIDANWTKLKDHVSNEHPDEFIKVQQWLHEGMSEKLIVAKRLADEGLRKK